MKKRAKALGLISGGLDSTLAAAVLLKQGVEVTGINFYTGFCITETQRRLGVTGKSLRNEPLRAGADLLFPVEFVDISEGYMEVILHPRYGYGANLNPCVDCRIYMMKKARQLLEERGDDFVFTGEVLGQRPKSQRRDTMRAIERDAGLTGRLLRPLSARLFPPTIAEEERLIDREQLYAFNGRSRKPQMALAQELGLEDYPQPAGGCCYLTDESYSRRFWDRIQHLPKGATPSFEDRILPSAGRHFRLSPTTKAIIGRYKEDNAVLQRYCTHQIPFEAEEIPGPLCLLEGEPAPELLPLLAGLCIRYGKGRHQPEQIVVCFDFPDGPQRLGPGLSLPSPEQIEAWRI
jgi:tRNA-uridine 2-sulfurtransferase